MNRLSYVLLVLSFVCFLNIPLATEALGSSGGGTVLIVLDKVGATGSEIEVPDVYIESPGILKTPMVVQIINDKGTVVFSTTSNSLAINCSLLGLPKGMYVLDVEIGKFQHQMKVNL